MPLDVLCPNCELVHFETNDQNGFSPYVTGLSAQFIKKYNPDVAASAAMIRLKEQFVGVRDDIPHDEDLFGEGIGPCPECGHSLSNTSFKLVTRPQPQKHPNACRYCNRILKSPQGKSSHEAACKEQ